MEEQVRDPLRRVSRMLSQCPADPFGNGRAGSGPSHRWRHAGVTFVGEFDEQASPLGTKGLGKLTAVSVAPAIANAVHHATGKRVRDLPITAEKLL